MLIRYLIAIILSAFCLVESKAQKGWEVGGTVGSAFYLGDLNTNYRINRPGPAARLFTRYNFNKRVCFKFAASYARVMAQDSDSKNTFEQSRNLSFASNIYDGSGELEFNFLPYTHGSEDEYFTPYLMGGLSVYKFNPKAKYEGNWYALQPFGTEGQFQGDEYSLTQMAFAFGGGIKLDLTAEWSLNVEISSRYLFTDYLDDVSTKYPDIKDVKKLNGPVAGALVDRSGELGIEPIGGRGRQRGNSKDRDSFHLLTIGVAYYFGHVRCPSVSKF